VCGKFRVLVMFGFDLVRWFQLMHFLMFLLGSQEVWLGGLFSCRFNLVRFGLVWFGMVWFDDGKT